jgi:hypothetical protein
MFRKDYRSQGLYTRAILRAGLVKADDALGKGVRHLRCRASQNLQKARDPQSTAGLAGERDLAARRNSWGNVFFDRPRFAEWDFHPTGRLSFEFERVYLFGSAVPRRSFRDAKVQRLENMASDIGVGIAVLAAAKTEQRLKREAGQRRIEEEWRQRELAARVKHIEDRRAAGLGAILVELNELDRLRRLISMLAEEVPAEPTPRLSAFLTRAKEHLAKCEARLSAQAIEGRFAEEHLFGDDDDHDFTPSRWY